MILNFIYINKYLAAKRLQISFRYELVFKIGKDCRGMIFYTVINSWILPGMNSIGLLK